MSKIRVKAGRLRDEYQGDAAGDLLEEISFMASEKEAEDYVNELIDLLEELLE